MAVSATDTKQTIMNAARLMVQARGYNALSFRELAKEVGIKSASIHYHFPTKGDLGTALAHQYTEDAIAFFNGVTEEAVDVEIAMQRYVAIFRAALMNDNRMCLCGILAAEYDDLPPEVRKEVDRFTDANVEWLMKMLPAKKGKAAVDEDVRGRALAVLSAIEGAQLMARGRSDLAMFDRTIAAYRVAGLIP